MESGVAKFSLLEDRFLSLWMQVITDAKSAVYYIIPYEI